MKAKQLGGSLQEQEEGGAKNALSALEKVLLTDGDDCRRRAHGPADQVLYLTKRAREQKGFNKFLLREGAARAQSFLFTRE